MTKSSSQKTRRWTKPEGAFLDRPTVIAFHPNGLPVFANTGPNAHFSDIELSKALDEGSMFSRLKDTQEPKGNRK
jgi:hypothetical protein